MLSARKGRDDVVHADLPRPNSQGRNLDHNVGPRTADVLGRRSANPAAAGFQGGGARVSEPQGLPQVDPLSAFHGPVPAGEDSHDRGIKAVDLLEFRSTFQKESRELPADVAETSQQDPTAHRRI